MERKPGLTGVSTVALYLLCILAHYSANGDGEVCNGRGHLGDNDKCVCDSEWPAEGQFGWAGPECSMRVYGASFSEGTDLTEQCKQHTCNFLMPDEWLCFAVPMDFHSEVKPWNYLTVQLERVSESEAGDPDLYGLFYDSSGRSKHLDNTTYSFDFRETSSSSHRTVVKKVKKREFVSDDAMYKGVYLCVKAYGDANVTYALRATATRCPSDFTEGGQQLVCSSPVGIEEEKRYSECTNGGECVCKPPYAKPVEHPYDFLGFDDCSAKVNEVPDASLTVRQPFVAQHEQLEVKGWSFYAFNVTSDDYQVVVNLLGEKDVNCSTAGYFGLFVKYGQPPGWRYGEWDYRPEWDYYSDKEKTVEIRFDRTSEGFHTGTWYAGVNGDDVHTCKYTITISKYECPLNCNSRGTCEHLQNGTRVCKCESRFFGPDCANEAHPLEFGKLVSMPDSNFEYEYFMLPEVPLDMLTDNVEVRLAASYSSSAYSEWAAARPELLLLKGNDSDMPSTRNYTFKQLLEAQNTTYEINLCPSQLKGGKWRVAVFNPIRLYTMAYNLTVEKHVHCLNDCNGHGTCQDGVCSCESPWSGGDCSVDQSKSCVQGNRRGTLRPESRGTCWQECQCPKQSRDCTFGGECVDFTCDDPSYRRKGNAAECVLDQCSKGIWTKTDDHVCLRECKCPADGSACRLDAECSLEHFECLPGYHRKSYNDLRCQPVTCKPGDLQTTQLSAGNGRAFQFCNCTGQACGFAPASLEAAVLLCDQGFAPQGAREWNSSGVIMHVGGRCVRAKRGTPGWGVFLWVFFTLPVGAILGIALQWYYETRIRRGGPLAEGLYHELSMDTGF